jgi:hypothetical protein
LCSSSGDKQRVDADVSFAVELKVFFFLSLAFYWSFFPFLFLTGFFFCAVEGGEVATEEKKRRRPRLRKRIFYVVLLDSSVTLMVDTSLEVKMKCMPYFFSFCC